jgi:hypothetical protein
MRVIARISARFRATIESSQLANLPPQGADKGRHVMRVTFEPLPSPFPPIPTFPRQGGRGIDLPLSAPARREGKWLLRTGTYGFTWCLCPRWGRQSRSGDLT